jgi:uncharacterized protein (TIGR02118 family)
MVKRISLVRRLPELDRDEFARRWLGEHVEIARRLPGLLEYRIDVLRPEGIELPYDGIAVTRFDSRAAAEAAFAVPELAADLRRTRDTFAAAADVVFADEHVVVAAR